MTNEELARGLWRQAESRYRTVQEAIRQEDYAYAIRSAQECVELCLKALLIAVGVDPPKWHDVGSVLLDHARRFPSLDRALLEEMAFISRNLRGDRERSMYGDEALGLSPDRLYSRYDGETAARWAEKIFGVCNGFFRDNKE
jgi:HEPN domain-containing protein